MNNNFNFKNSVQAESGLLACFLMNNSFVENAIQRGLNYQLFARSEHAHICKLIIELHNTVGSFDVVSVFEEAIKKGVADDFGGLPYLNSLSQSIASSGHWSQYLDIVKDRAQRRKFAETLLNLSDKAYEDLPFSELLAQAEAAISGLSYKTKIHTPIKLSQAMMMALQEMDDKQMGLYKPIYFGISSLDKMLGGVDRGDLIVLGARPSHGKTAISLEIALNMARAGYATAMLQMEMSNKSLAYRIKSRLSGVPMALLKNEPKKLGNEDWEKISGVYQKIENIPFWLHDQPALSIEQISAYAKFIKKSSTGLDLLIIDHIHLTSDMSGQKLRRDQELARVSGGLKRLAKELDCVVLCLAQLNKGLEGEPKLKDLRECGAIEQDADVVMLNYYPFKDNENELDKNTFILNVAKARNGETGRINLHFDGATQAVGDALTPYDFKKQAEAPFRNARRFGL